jgi:hypothetical protein
MSREIQSKHFGVSQIQITLHTGYFITGTMDKVQFFCGVSYSLQHDPMSVWAHLNPILKKIREEHPDVDTLQFFSDGPTSQYKQKLNFYLFSTELFEHGFKRGYWNFHTAGHGKGIPDGIGASLKRSADIRVKHGEDVVNATQFIKQMHQSGSKVEVYQIQEQDIKEIERKMKDKNLKAIHGTMKMHPLTTEQS